MCSGRLQGRVALITGAAGGIGASTARAMAAQGASVLVTDADGERAQRLAGELGERARGRAQDVRSEQEWEEVLAWALEREDGVDALVNNAGVFLAAPLAETSREDFTRVLEVNLTGVFLGMRTLAPAMARRGGGSIVNVSSVAGLMGSAYLSAYAASKWGVRGLTKVAAKELAQAGVRVNSVHPGQIDTDMNARQRERTPELVDRLIAAIPMRRIGTPEEVASAIVFLASQESAYVTGAELAVDGATSA